MSELFELQDSRFAILHFDAVEEQDLVIKVDNFVIEEALGEAFEVVVRFHSPSAKIPFDSIVGRGAALTLQTAVMGERVWAGVCSELELEHSEEHTGPADPSPFDDLLGKTGLSGESYKGHSRYRAVIRPDLWRLTLRQNCRIFQKLDAKDILSKICKDDYGITVETKLADKHPVWEFKVQYNESDFQFVSRLCEETGISIRVVPHNDVPATEKKKGHELTKLLLVDNPQAEKPIYDADQRVLLYAGDDDDDDAASEAAVGRHPNVPHIWRLAATQRPRPLHVAMRGRHFRSEPDQDPDGTYPKKKELRDERYEHFSYEPNAFWAEVTGASEKHADDRGRFRNDPELQEKLPERRYHEELAGRRVIQFKSNALDLEPGAVFQIGKDEPGFLNHPHPLYKPEHRFLVIHRRIEGHEEGSGYRCICDAVSADKPFRPRRKTPKPRIHGLQSAVVVGPKGLEIHTDEHGRVRVQFPWDRYGTFDDKSSCWLRVSQAWSGGKFGWVTIPRIGTEVLVAFYEGDPDQPLIVGRLFNALAGKPPWKPVTGRDKLGDNWTKSGIRTDSSPHGGKPLGYNELLFQDQAGREEIHFQAQKDFTYVINQAERKDIGTSATHNIGASETHHVGSSFNLVVGAGPGTTISMTPTSIVLTTGQASIKLEGGHIEFQATNEAHYHAKNKFSLTSKQLVDADAKKMTIDTQGPSSLLLAPQAYAPHNADPKPAEKANGPARGLPSKRPKLPSGGGLVPPTPADLEHVSVGYDPPLIHAHAHSHDLPLLDPNRSLDDQDLERQQQAAGVVEGIQERSRPLIKFFKPKELPSRLTPAQEAEVLASLDPATQAFLKRNPASIRFVDTVHVPAVIDGMKRYVPVAGVYYPNEIIISTNPEIYQARHGFGAPFAPGSMRSTSAISTNIVEATKACLRHEVGHHVHLASWPVQGGLSGSEYGAAVDRARATEALFKENIVKTYIDAKSPFTQYGSVNAMEYFAETYSSYYRFPDALKAHDPSGYAMVEGALKARGIE